MNKKILIGCFEVPSHGGASTSSYSLFEKMQKDGYDVNYISIISDYDADYFRFLFKDKIGNPKGLRNVINCFLSRPIFHPKPSHTEFVEILRDISPDIMIGIDFIATVIMKREFPHIPNIFLTCGCDQASKYISEGKANNALELISLISNTNGHEFVRPKLYKSLETEAIQISDLIITHSDLNRTFCNYFFPNHRGKIFPEVIWFAEWIYEDAQYYSKLKKTYVERDIDLLFVSSLWERQVKNYSLMKKIFMKNSNLNIHIVGEVEQKIENVNYHGFITDREKIFELLGRSKTVVSTSLLDAAPGLLFEASAMGCNIIASKNCGNWEICNEDLLVDNYRLGDYLEKIHLSLTKKYDDNIDYFLDNGSYRNLLDIIAVM